MEPDILGGGTPSPTPETPPPAPPTAPPDLLQAFAALRTEVETYRAEKQAREAQAAHEKQQDLIRKGQLDEIAKNHDMALKAKDAALAALDSRARSTELRRALTEALSGHELRDGAMGQLTKLWGDEFQVDDDGDGFKVRSKSDLRDPKTVFAERLKSPEFDHFLKATHRGGSGVGADQGRKAAESTAQANPFLAAAEQLRQKFGMNPTG